MVLRNRSREVGLLALMLAMPSCGAYAVGQTLLGLVVVVILFAVWLFYRIVPGAARAAEARDKALQEAARQAGSLMVQRQRQFDSLLSSIRSEMPDALISGTGSVREVRVGDRLVSIAWTSKGISVAMPTLAGEENLVQSERVALELVRSYLQEQ